MKQETHGTRTLARFLIKKIRVVEDDDEEEAEKMKPVSLVVDKEITNALIQQEAACVVMDDD